MTTVMTEVYRPAPWAGTALAPERPGDLEAEIREQELVQKQALAAESGLVELANRCRVLLAKIRCARAVPFPLMTDEEVSIWHAFLPMCYSSASKEASPYGPLRAWASYEYDQPPVTVLETLRDVRREGTFDTLNIRTPEQVLRPDPILTGYRTFDKVAVGPFLIARWGEALEPYEQIRAHVEERFGPTAQRRQQEMWNMAMQLQQARALQQMPQTMQGIPYANLQGQNPLANQLTAGLGLQGSLGQGFQGIRGKLGVPLGVGLVVARPACEAFTGLSPAYDARPLGALRAHQEVHHAKHPEGISLAGGTGKPRDGRAATGCGGDAGEASPGHAQWLG
jgi:hypothetical protein